MGQASSSVSNAPAVPSLQGTTNYLADLGGDLVYDKSLGQSRFLKAIRAAHRSTLGRVVIKVRPQGDAAAYEHYARRLNGERDALHDVPNALPYQRVASRERAGYLLRQWVANNLYDRISTRPFLSLIEKKWITFQLLTALRDIHERNIAHGDLKSENVLCTTANWVYITDFACFKPTFLPLNDPADFAYFFDASGRRTCNLAPERFYAPGEAKPDLTASVTEAMDVFALGCVIAEICSDGVSPFTLSQMFKYRMGEFTPNLTRIEDSSLKAMVTSMLSVEPTKRLSCAEYLNDHRDRAFPDVFFRLHPFLAEINEMTVPAYNGESSTGPMARTGADEKLDRIWADLELVSSFITGAAAPVPEAQPFKTPLSLFPVQLNVPSFEAPLTRRGKGKARVDDPAALLVSTLVCANIRNCSHPSSVVRALDLLIALAVYLSDETQLDRLLPYMVALLEDASALVRAAALRSLTQLLLLINTMTPSNADVFSEYVLPNIIPLATDVDILVRCTYAQCLAPLADVGSRLLDLSRGMLSANAEQTTTSSSSAAKAAAAREAAEETSYDEAYASLQSKVLDQAKTMLVDDSTSVKRALLKGLAPLCVFFGRSQTADVLLSHCTTYLNSPDWSLRAAFFEACVGLAACIGGKSVEQYLLPLMTQALTDVEEAVVARVLSSLTTLVEIGLVQKAGFWDIYDLAVGLLCHPNAWIRRGTAAFVAAACHRVVLPADVWCTLYPSLRPLLVCDITACTELDILGAALPPLPRAVLEAATSWAGEASRTSPFWKGATSRSADDQEHIDRFKALGAGPALDVQLHALRPYLLKRSAKAQHSLSHNLEAIALLDGQVSLQSLGIMPQNIFYNIEKANSLGKGPAPTNRLHQVDGWPRRFASSNGGGSPSMPSSRSTSDANVVDDLRRRLALSGGGSSSSLGSMSRQSLTPLTINGDGGSRRDSLNSMIETPSVPEGMTASSATIRPGPSATRPWGRVGGAGIEVGRVSPAVASDSTTAVGTMNLDVRSPRSEDDVSSFASPLSGRSKPVVQAQRFRSDYEGNEPGIRSLLERTYLDGASEPMPEFGPRIVAGAPRKRAPKATSHRPNASGRPEGTLIAHLTEHTAAITSLAVSPDSVFFVTGSDDGTARVWDAMRLEKSVTSRSRSVIRHGARVTAVCALEQSHCVATASADGALCVHRVDVDLSSGSLPKYGKAQIIRQMAIEPAGDYVTAMAQVKVDANNVEGVMRLIYATSLATIAAVDLRTMRLLFSLQNSPAAGPITSLLVDPVNPKSSWLLVGTASGQLALWDMRFHLLIRSWSAANGPIHRLVLHPARGRGRWVIVAADAVGNDVDQTLLQVWDIDRGQLVERYGVAASSRSSSSSARPKSPTITAAKDERPSAADAITALLEGRDETTSSNESTRPLSATYDVAVGSLPHDPASTHGSPSSTRNALTASGEMVRPSLAYLVTAGEDSKLRLWDLDDVEQSSCFVGASDGPAPTYTTMAGPPITQHLEVPGRVRPSQRHADVMAREQARLKAPGDAVTAVGLLELPFRCVVAADRAGSVRVYH